jgi:hypothetical protein
MEWRLLVSWAIERCKVRPLGSYHAQPQSCKSVLHDDSAAANPAEEGQAVLQRSQRTLVPFVGLLVGSGSCWSAQASLVGASERSVLLAACATPQGGSGAFAAPMVLQGGPSSPPTSARPPGASASTTAPAPPSAASVGAVCRPCDEPGAPLPVVVLLLAACPPCSAVLSPLEDWEVLGGHTGPSTLARPRSPASDAPAGSGLSPRKAAAPKRAPGSAATPALASIPSVPGLPSAEVPCSSGPSPALEPPVGPGDPAGTGAESSPSCRHCPREWLAPGTGRSLARGEGPAGATAAAGAQLHSSPCNA